MKRVHDDSHGLNYSFQDYANDMERDVQLEQQEWLMDVLSGFQSLRLEIFSLCYDAEKVDLKKIGCGMAKEAKIYTTIFPLIQQLKSIVDYILEEDSENGE